MRPFVIEVWFKDGAHRIIDGATSCMARSSSRSAIPGSSCAAASMLKRGRSPGRTAPTLRQSSCDRDPSATPTRHRVTPREAVASVRLKAEGDTTRIRKAALELLSAIHEKMAGVTEEEALAILEAENSNIPDHD